MKKYIILFLIIILLGLTFYTRTEERTQLKMGTFVKIVLAGPLWSDFDATFTKAFAAVDKVDLIASIYNNESEVVRLNQEAAARPIKVSNELFTLIKDSIAMSRDSNGAFDITVAPLVRLWGSYKKEDSIPTKKEIEKKLSLVGYDKIVIDEADGSVYFKKKGMAVDLSAIAKGYAIDSVVKVIKDQGFRSAMVNAGGDLYCLGQKSLLHRWQIGIIDPRNRDMIIRVLTVSDRAVATSGGYEQYFVYKGKGYTHLIHPKTGYPVESVFSSVTVIAPNATMADGIATAVSVGGNKAEIDIKKIYPDIDIIIVD